MFFRRGLLCVVCARVCDRVFYSDPSSIHRLVGASFSFASVAPQPAHSLVSPINSTWKKVRKVNSEME